MLKYKMVWSLRVWFGLFIRFGCVKILVWFGFRSVYLCDQYSLAMLSVSCYPFFFFGQNFHVILNPQFSASLFLL